MASESFINSDMKELVSNLKHTSMDETEIRLHLRSLYANCFESVSDLVFSMAPGRVNLIGDHTDYNDGYVLPMSIENAVYTVLGPSNNNVSRIYSANYDEFYECSIEKGVFEANGQKWTQYVAGVLNELKNKSLITGEINAVIYGNVPLGAGLSSSAALEISFCLGLQTLYDFDLSAVAMAELCQYVEARYAGVNCGIMDQFISRVGKSNQALFLDCRDMEHEHVLIPDEGVKIVVVDSRVKRELASSVYNKRAQECKDAVRILNQNGFDLETLRDVRHEDLGSILEILEEPLCSRVRHVVLENKRVKDAVAAIRKNDFSQFGELMVESHTSLKNDYQVSCPEMDFLVDLALHLPFCIGSRMTGGGFGGSSVNLVYSDGIDEFEKQLKSSYKKAYGLNLRVFPIMETLEAKADLF